MDVAAQGGSGSTRRRPTPKLVSRWFQHPAADLGIALIVGLAAVAVSYWIGSWGLEELRPATRRALYQTLTTVSGTLLGLALTSISVLNTALRQPVSGLTAKVVTSDRKQSVAQLFFAAVRALALSTVVYVVALLADTEARAGSKWLQASVLATALLGALRIGRTFWALSLIIATSATAPADIRPSRPPITDDEL